MSAITKTYLQSAIRPGRQAVAPVWDVDMPDAVWRFRRKMDAARFINYGSSCPEHARLFCRNCFGQRIPKEGRG